MIPNPLEFEDFKIEYKREKKFSNQKYDLNEVIKTYRSNKIPAGKISELLNINLLKSNPKIQEILKKYIAYDTFNESIVVILDDKVAAIRRTKDNIKWKSFGSKSYIKISINKNDDVIFVVFGMLEIILCEIFNLSYIGFQSDGIAKNIINNEQFNEDLKEKMEGKSLILLLDNDESCQSTVKHIESAFEGKIRVVSIEMQNLYDFYILSGNGFVRDVPKGYDFRDFCNQVGDIKEIEFAINAVIEVFGNGNK